VLVSSSAARPGRIGNADTARLRPLTTPLPDPAVADESCWTWPILPRLAPHVDGVNIRLLKTAGLP